MLIDVVFTIGVGEGLPLVNADETTRQDFQTFLKTHRLSSHVRCVARKPSSI